MKRYDSYKDSGVEWIGEVPSHWDVLHFRHTIKHITTGLNPRDNFQLGEGNNFYVTIRNFQNGKIFLDENCDLINDKALKIIHNRSKIQKGDLLFASISENGKAVVIKEDPINWDINESVFAIRPNNRLNSDYLFYVITDYSFYKPLRIGATGTTFSSIKQDQLKSGLIVCPPFSEQRIIASYLDSKCGEIDKVISNQEKRIALLQELKQSIITHAVTKGLNPNVKMKDSGIEWIGEVPEHWEVYKTSLAFNKIGSGTTPKSSEKSYYDDDGYYWLQTGDLNDGNIIDTSKKITKKAVVECKMKFYPKGSIVIAMYGATIGKLGLLHINTSTNQACCVLCPSKKIYNTFAFYIYKSAKQEMLIDAMGGGQPNISQDIIRLLRIPVPPLTEQKEIASYLDKRCSSIDASISKAQREIELLQEYKQSLITEVVTGKRKVC